MQDEMIMYVRDKKNAPIGATYYKSTGLSVGDTGDTRVVVMGWSKAYKTDTFTKKMGRTIATKRATKAINWVNGDNTDLTGNLLFVGSEELNAQIDSIPFVIKNNLNYYLDAAKEGLGFGSDKEVVFVLPVIEKFVDLAPVLKRAITTDSDIDTSKAKITTVTRYLTILY